MHGLAIKLYMRAPPVAMKLRRSLRWAGLLPFSRSWLYQERNIVPGLRDRRLFDSFVPYFLVIDSCAVLG